MTILKCTKNVQFKNGHNLILSKSINKSLRDIRQSDREKKIPVWLPLNIKPL